MTPGEPSAAPSGLGLAGNMSLEVINRFKLSHYPKIDDRYAAASSLAPTSSP